jgi:hypothetical protein
MSQARAWVDALHRDDWALPSGLCRANGSDVAQRFGIYRNNVLSACTHALADTFPVCQALVGKAFFTALSLAFAQQHLPRSRRLAFYGQGFAAFVRQFPPAQSLPYLADLAQLEMARVQAYHAADADGVSPDHLQAALHPDADLPAWRFTLHPSLHLIDSPMAALSLWQAHQHDAKQRDALLADIDLHRPECAAVFRSDDVVLTLPLSAADAALLRGLQAGLTLGEAIAQAPAGADGEALDISHTLALLIQHQLITDVMAPPTEHTPQGD